MLIIQHLFYFCWVKLFFITGLLACSVFSYCQINTKIISGKDYSPNETTIAINPKNTNEVVVGANINHLYITKDSFASWTHFTASSKLGVYGDPVLHYGLNNLFYAHLSKTPGKKYGDWFDRIVVQKISDLEEWSETSYSVGFNEDKMQDKPWLSSDNFSMKFYGNVYVTWTEFDKYNSSDTLDRSRIRFSRFTPSSDSFSKAITISDTTGNCLDGDNTLEGATTAIGSNGEIYAVWAGHDFIWFDKSFDGGITWNKDVKIAFQKEGWDMDMPNIFRANGMPFIACDNMRNILYVCWADETNGNADIWLKSSRDQGRTWSERIKLNNDTTSQHQYFPNMTIDQKSGDVFVSFYDQRHSSKNIFYDIYLAQLSPDLTLKNHRITSKSIPLPGKNFFYGDYLDIDCVDDVLALAYSTYNLSYKSDVEVAWMKLDDIYFVEERQNAVNVVSQKDSTSIYLNQQHPFKIKLKLRTSAGNCTVKLRMDEVTKDHDLLLNAVKGKYYSKLKYKIVDLSSKRKYRFKM